jgi:hypothetical protein
MQYGSTEFYANELEAEEHEDDDDEDDEEPSETYTLEY